MVHTLPVTPEQYRHMEGVIKLVMRLYRSVPTIFGVSRNRLELVNQP